MADVSSPAVVAAGITVGGVSVVAGVPVWTVLAAVLGASIAVAQSGRMEMSVRGLATLFVSFVAGASLGVFGGAFLGSFLGGVLVALLTKLGVAPAQPVQPPDALLAFLLALQGQDVILPALARRLGVEISNRGAP